MNFNYRGYIPADFNDSSRVWIYQANRRFSPEEAADIEPMLKQFVAAWASHGEKVKGFAQLFFNHFIVLMADETATGVSGCSTDSSVRLMKEIEQHLEVQLFDRQLLAFILDEDIRLMPLTELNQAVNGNLLNADTLYFNNTVLSKKELLESWITPVKNSWLGKRIERKEMSS